MLIKLLCEFGSCRYITNKNRQRDNFLLEPIPVWYLLAIERLAVFVFVFYVRENVFLLHCQNPLNYAKKHVLKACEDIWMYVKACECIHVKAYMWRHLRAKIKLTSWRKHTSKNRNKYTQRKLFFKRRSHQKKNQKKIKIKQRKQNKNIFVLKHTFLVYTHKSSESKNLLWSENDLFFFLCLQLSRTNLKCIIAHRRWNKKNK